MGPVPTRLTPHGGRRRRAGRPQELLLRFRKVRLNHRIRTVLLESWITLLPTTKKEKGEVPEERPCFGCSGQK
jgi:hypothetical protein